MPPGPYYITTPIYYVNDRPHIGHCYTTTIADIAARFQRLIRGTSSPKAVPPSSPIGGGGESAAGGRAGGGSSSPASTSSLPDSRFATQDSRVFLLTGTDEHADKVVTSAAEHGVTPQAWADKNAAEFRKAFEFMNVAFDDFIRTTEPRHKDKVPGYIQALMASGDIYKGEYTGWYDEGQEEYVTETIAKESGFKSPISGRPLIKRTEPCYFFKLSKYQKPLLDHIAKCDAAGAPFIQPDARRQEVLGRLRQGLNDVPVSRPVTTDPATQWGIRMPGDPANRIYVWIDALFNYYTAVDTPERKHLWPPAVHLLGKDILWFHAVIWPAMLMALRLPLPGVIFGHGWWVSNGQKMSKSLGNFIDLERLEAYAKRYSIDGVRWFLGTQGPLGGADSDFSHAKFVEVYNADLANGIGNSSSRVGNMVDKYFGGTIPARPSSTVHRIERPNLQGAEFDWARTAQESVSQATMDADRMWVHTASRVGIDLVKKVDGYINVTEPFKRAKLLDSDPSARPELEAVLYNCAEALRIASLFLAPAMPTKMSTLWATWNCAPPPGIPLAELAQFGGPHSLKPGQRISKGDALFMRADPAEPAP